MLFELICKTRKIFGYIFDIDLAPGRKRMLRITQTDWLELLQTATNGISEFIMVLGTNQGK
jgi:hypothetical protein